MVTPRDDWARRLDGKLNALLAITGVILILLVLAAIGLFDLAT